MRIDQKLSNAPLRILQPREQIIKAELYKILKDETEVERMFLVIKSQAAY